MIPDGSQDSKPQTKITDFFDQIYIINLAERVDRRREIEHQFKRIGLALPINNICVFPAIRPGSPGEFPSIGAKGCFLSHLGILEEATMKGLERILICEDDLNFARDFTKRAPDILKTLCEIEWALFYGSYRIEEKFQKLCDSELAVLPSTSAVQTTHFIALQGPSITLASQYLKAILDRPAGDPRGGPMHVDGAYTWFRKENPQFRTLLAIPELGYQRPSRSDIFAATWYDRAPVLSTAIEAFRRAKSAVKQLKK